MRPSGFSDVDHVRNVVVRARAPTVKVPAFVNSMMRLVFKFGGKLKTFLHSFLGNSPLSRCETVSMGPLWPIPAPYPEVFGQQPAFGATWRKRRVVLQVLLMDWLYLGRPSICPKQLWLGRSLNGRQWRRVRLLEDLSEDGNSLQEVDALVMARAAAKTEASSDELDSLHRAWASASYAWTSYGGASTVTEHPKDEDFEWARHSSLYGHFVGEAKGEQFAVAKPIVADRLVFVGTPQFDPVPYLDAETAYSYEHPLLCARAEPECEIPKVSVHASSCERNRLFKKMAEGNRLVPLLSSEVREGLESGLFAVPKDLDRDRLILDARPPNTMERVLNKWTKTMASGTCLCQLEIEPTEVLIMSGRDVRDYFYQFVVSAERARRNVLAGKLSASDLSFIFGRPIPEDGYVGLNTLAMGDCNACEYAQSSHLQLLLASGGAVWEELLMMHSPPPRSLLSIGVVIDDLVCLERVCKDRLSDGKILGETAMDERMALFMRKYDEVKLPTNPKKAFDNSLHGSFWGVQVDGEKGLVRGNESRLWPLLLVTVRICSLKLATVGLLRSIAGSFISLLMLRRRLLSSMNYIFDAIAAGQNDKEILRLSDDLVDELFTMMVLSMLAVVNLRARTMGTLRATDASDWGMAAVGASIPVAIAREAMRISLSRSVWSKLLPPSKAWLRVKGLLDPLDELPGEEAFDVHPFWEALARVPLFKEHWRRAHPKPVHVNIGELRAHLREESRIATDCTSVRVPYALDSQVALGALVKGRASSKALNLELIKSIPLHVGSDLYSGFGFWPSKLNRADGPTRDADPDPPDLMIPAWWTSLCAGDPKPFDDWLQSYDGDLRLEKINAESHGEDSPGEKIDLRPNAEVRKARVHSRAANSDETLGDLRGKATGTLCGKAVELLRTFELHQFLFEGKELRLNEPGALDLYSGKGGVAKAMVKGGCPWVLSFEILRSTSEDLLVAETQRKLIDLILLGAFKTVGSALVCKSFSVAVTPPVRNQRFPRGVPWMSSGMREKVRDGNAMSDFQAELHLTCEKAEPRVFFWTENPDPSWLWRQRKHRKFRDPGADAVARVDFCRFGTAWRKRTRIANNIPSLQGLRMFCTCSRAHVRLRGQHPTLKKPWTAVAQPYPRGFAKLLAGACLDAARWSQKLDIAGCSRSLSLRVGEAANPGPRRSVYSRGFSLEDAPVQSWTSINLGERKWNEFLDWASLSVDCDPLTLFLQVPLFLAHAIRRFGDLEFTGGGSLLYYRHLVLTAQRKVPNVRPFVSICWDLASRWEKAEPTKHRPPVPEVLMEAMVALAWSLGWRRWCGVTLLCFFGIARAGEVLRCCRADLLLPFDMMYECESAFLLLRHSKTMYRQLAKVQHLKINSPLAVKLLNKVYLHGGRGDQLFPGTPHMSTADDGIIYFPCSRCPRDAG